ncbi:PCNA-associated factor-like [Lineus longissimus]|uniref:PCNA-associated factor-like n=1 Tax=Lineus longissimus TaxID=88925 RepID=UPI002B4CCF4D
MVRTKSDNTARKAVAAKAPRKALVTPSPRAGLSSPKGRSSGSSKNRWAGGNPAVKREVPDWQKPITGFFSPSKKDKENSTPEDEENDIVEVGQSSNDIEESETPSAQSSGSSETSSKSNSKDDLMDSDDDE